MHKYYDKSIWYERIKRNGIEILESKNAIRSLKILWKVLAINSSFLGYISSLLKLLFTCTTLNIMSEEEINQAIPLTEASKKKLTIELKILIVLWKIQEAGGKNRPKWMKRYSICKY